MAFGCIVHMDIMHTGNKTIAHDCFARGARIMVSHRSRGAKKTAEKSQD